MNSSWQGLLVTKQMYISANMLEAAFLQFARTYAPYKPGVRDIQIFNTQTVSSIRTRCQFRSFPLTLSNPPLCMLHQADFLYELERETEVIILF
jgi:hypothetical protein